MNDFILSSLPHLKEDSGPDSHNDTVETVEWIVNVVFLSVLVLETQQYHLIDE
jgi:hypothetical protein